MCGKGSCLGEMLRSAICRRFPAMSICRQLVQKAEPIYGARDGRDGKAPTGTRVVLGSTSPG